MKAPSYSTHEQAFSDMNNHTKVNEPFKLSFRKDNGQIKIVSKALLRKQTPTNQDKNGAYKFNYIDVVNDNMGSAYIPLLLSVNDKEIRL